MLKSLVFVPNAYFNVALDAIVQEFSLFNNIRISCFIKNFCNRYTENIDNCFELKTEYRNYIRLIEKISLTTNHAETYNNAISTDFNYSKVGIVDFFT
jgi:hypothetical protein